VVVFALGVFNVEGVELGNQGAGAVAQHLEVSILDLVLHVNLMRQQSRAWNDP
jgi:hypothetical protein